MTLDTGSPAQQQLSGRASPRVGRRPPAGLLVLPALAVLLVVFAVPVVMIMARSFTDFLPSEAGRGAWANYGWVLGEPVNVTVLVRTFMTALLVTVVCLLAAYPYAYLMTIVGRGWRNVLIGVVLLTFWTSLMVRNFSWLILLQDSGLLNQGLGKLGLGPFTFAGSTTGVVIGMCQILLPFMILPLYATLRGIDRGLLHAAQSLGARPAIAFIRIYLPLSAPGVAAGALLVFIMSLGFYITPAILGSPQNAMFSQLIVTQVSNLLAWGRGGAMAVLLLLATLLCLAVVGLVSRGARSSGGLVGDSRGGSPVGSHGISRALLWILSGVVALWLVAPTLVVVPMSFTGQRTYRFPPTEWSTRWYEEFFTDGAWLKALGTSLSIALVVALLATALGTAAAFGLVRGRFPGRSVVGAALLSPLVVPAVITAIGVYLVFLPRGLVGNPFGLVLAQLVLAIPFVVVTVRAGLQTFDPTLEMAAASLGAGTVSTLRAVTLPILLPAVLTGGLFAFITAFDELVVSSFLVDADTRTLPVQMFTSVARESDPTVAVAATVMLVLTTGVLAVAAVVGRRIRVGR